MGMRDEAGAWAPPQHRTGPCQPPALHMGGMGILVKVNTSQFHSSAPVHAPAIWILWQRGVPGGDMLELWLYCMPCGSLAGTRRHSLHGPHGKRPGKSDQDD